MKRFSSYQREHPEQGDTETVGELISLLIIIQTAVYLFVNVEADV